MRAASEISVVLAVCLALLTLGGWMYEDSVARLESVGLTLPL